MSHQIVSGKKNIVDALVRAEEILRTPEEIFPQAVLDFMVSYSQLSADRNVPLLAAAHYAQIFEGCCCQNPLYRIGSPLTPDERRLAIRRVAIGDELGRS